MKTLFYERHGWWIALLGVVLLPFVVVLGLQALASNANEVSDWLPSDYPETADYQWFRERFRYDEFALITWEGCTLDDERLDRLAEELESGRWPPDSAGANRFQRVVTGRGVLRELQEGSNFSREEAVAKLKNALVGPDGSHTCAITFLTREGRNDSHGTLAILRAATKKVGVKPEDLRMGGPPVINAAIDQTSASSINRVVVVACLMVTIIAWISIRDLRLMILVLVTGLYSAGIALAVVRITGELMNAVLITMVPMVYVAATSGAIHLCNYYLESVLEEGLVGAAGRAVAHAWIPLGLATATTAAGLLSICYTDLTLIKSFGVYSAIGVALSWVMLVAWLPAALTVWKPRGVKHEKVESTDGTGEAPLAPFWLRLGERVTARPTLHAGACLLLGFLCAPGMGRMQITIDLMQEFRPEAELIRTYRWLEEKLGSLGTLEVIIRMNDECRLNTHQRVRLVERLQRRLEELPQTGGSMSAATFVPEVQSGGPAWLRQGVVNTRFEKQRPRLLESGYLVESDGEELWRISVRVKALESVDYSQLVADLRQEVDEELDSDVERGREGIRVTYTGVSPVLFKARQSLVDGLYFGVATDLLLIVVTVTLAMRHWSNGLLMTFVSLFPTCMVLGLFGWTQVQIDLGAIMAPCVALGVTVDDVVHFLLWFRTGAQRGLSQRDSVMLAWKACVRPMYQSWALLGLGMSSLLISEFLPILQFGAVMVAMLTVGLLGNLFLLPALLAGPLGGIIARRARAASPDAHVMALEPEKT